MTLIDALFACEAMAALFRKGANMSELTIQLVLILLIVLVIKKK